MCPVVAFFAGVGGDAADAFDFELTRREDASPMVPIRLLPHSSQEACEACGTLSRASTGEIKRLRQSTPSHHRG